MKKLVLLLCVGLMLGAGFSAYAQRLEDVVYLKNGSVVRGVIVEQVPGERIKIETIGGSLFVYQQDEITKITKEEVRGAVADGSASKKAKPGHGYFVDINIGYSFQDQVSNYFDVQLVNGYQFGPYFGLGGGTGFKFDNEGVAIPVFVNFRSEFLKGGVTPYASLNVGYNIAVSGYYEGFYLEPKLGVGLAVSPRVQLNLAISYTMNDAIGVVGTRFYYEQMCNGFRLSFGVKF